jgi:hypothetical protein
LNHTISQLETSRREPTNPVLLSGGVAKGDEARGIARHP